MVCFNYAGGADTCRQLETVVEDSMKFFEGVLFVGCAYVFAHILYGFMYL
jgi:hypothetical protein